MAAAALARFLQNGYTTIRKMQTKVLQTAQNLPTQQNYIGQHCAAPNTQGT